ncbi:MAG: carbohydrate kinase family protein [Candidatus Vogelbacteria bacterium]|nr:carbohydrate kinase family protein [Candidatus Vogelbacteria bacterium]
MENFDLISIGDNATDAFIRLSEAELNCEIDKPECKICLKFASKIPYDSVTEVPAGGNSSNVAIGSTKLGLKVAYISNIGDDEHGVKTLNKLNLANINTTWVKKNPGIPTNYNYVLWYADDRTILVKHENFPNYFPYSAKASQGKPTMPETNWLYLSSISDNDGSLHQQIADWLTAHPEIKLAFSPGTWQIKTGVEKLKNIYAQTEIIFCNKQEAEKIAPSLLRNQTSSEPEVWLRELAQQIKSLGPRTVVITDGENGASVLDDQNNFYQIPATKVEAVERTGAGDAFASAYLTATIANLPANQALAWGILNSASVVTKIGPHEGLLTRAQIEEKLASQK